MSQFEDALSLVVQKMNFHSLEKTVDFSDLANYLDDLIERDFGAVVTILYRMDVSEQKVRYNLANPIEGESAGAMLASMLIQREIEKMKWRERYKNGDL